MTKYEWEQKIMEDERRMINERTGGEKGQKLARFDLIPPGPLWSLAVHYGVGARKYADRNWERGYEWSLSFGAMMRHAWAFWMGEEIDPENGQPHLAAVLFHAMALMEFGDTHPELDDRPATATNAHHPNAADDAWNWHESACDPLTESEAQAAMRAEFNRGQQMTKPEYEQWVRSVVVERDEDCPPNTVYGYNPDWTITIPLTDADDPGPQDEEWGVPV